MSSSKKKSAARREKSTPPGGRSRTSTRDPSLAASSTPRPPSQAASMHSNRDLSQAPQSTSLGVQARERYTPDVPTLRAQHGPSQTSTSTAAQSDDDPLNISGGGTEDQSARSATMPPSTVYREKDGSESTSEDDEEAVSFGSEATRTQFPTPAPSNTLTLEDAISSLNRAAEFFLRRDVPADEYEAVNTLRFTWD